MLPIPIVDQHDSLHVRSKSRRGLFVRSRAGRLCLVVSVVALLTVAALRVIAPSHLKGIPYLSSSLDLPKAGVRPAPLHFDEEPQDEDSVDWEKRAEMVKQEFLYGYRAYRSQAYPNDELRPVTNMSINNFNGWAVSMVDGMDTMLLMGLQDEYRDALRHVEHMDFKLPGNLFAHYFETVIRYMGGMLSAYALSGERDTILLAKAEELAHKLMPAFETGSGFPTSLVNPETGVTNIPQQPDKPGYVVLAEIASFQLEYRYLAHLTGNKTYFDLAENANKRLQMAQNMRANGLWSSVWETTNGSQSNNRFTVGAWADSAYEYLLKQYLLTSKTEPRFRRMYLRAMSSILAHMLYVSPSRQLLFVTDIGLDNPDLKPQPSYKLEHLSCFFPGLLALGHLRLGDEVPERHLWAAEGLGETCWLMYAESPSGLGNEEAIFNDGGERWIDALDRWEKAGRQGVEDLPPGTKVQEVIMRDRQGRGVDYVTANPFYLLRPETIESIYILYRTTKNPIWRQRGWLIFKALARHCRLSTGYSSIVNVDFDDATDIRNKRNESPSYAFAETWKYLYLLFKEDDLVPLDKWVFNTEAHPFPVFEWSDDEKRKFGVLSS